jgi:hypothetical protein
VLRIGSDQPVACAAGELRAPVPAGRQRRLTPTRCRIRITEPMIALVTALLVPRRAFLAPVLGRHPASAYKSLYVAFYEAAGRVKSFLPCIVSFVDCRAVTVGVGLARFRHSSIRAHSGDVLQLPGA